MHYSISYSIIHSLFLKDFDYTWSLCESNRSTRSRSSGQCASAKSGNTICAILLPIQSFIYYFLQALITIHLSDNRIGPQGAECLANALQKNKVTRLALLYFAFSHSFPISNRHWSHWISPGIESVIKEQNIWLMYYNKTKYYDLYCSASYSTIHSLFSTDTDYTWSLCEWNRSRRSRIFG